MKTSEMNGWIWKLEEQIEGRVEEFLPLLHEDLKVCDSSASSSSPTKASVCTKPWFNVICISRAHCLV